MRTLLNLIFPYAVACLLGIVIYTVGFRDHWSSAKLRRETWEIRFDGRFYHVLDNHDTSGYVWFTCNTYDEANMWITNRLADYLAESKRGKPHLSWPIVTNTYGR